MPSKAITVAAGDSTDAPHHGNRHGGGGHHNGHHGGGGGHDGKLPFRVASRQMTRFSFTTGAVVPQAAASTPINPIQIPAVGYLAHINLEVTIASTGAGTGGAFAADGPFNVLSAVELRTAAGNDIIAPMTGYQLYLADKYGCQFAQAPYSDNRLSRQYSASVSATVIAAHFFLQIPLEIDQSTGLGAIPALAANRSYQLAMTLASISTFWPNTTPGTMTVTVNGTAYYWSEPPAVTQKGLQQHTHPDAVGTFSQYQIEQPPLTPGDKYIRSNNTGNVLRNIILVLRNSSGVRIDTNGWPAVTELYLDNEPMFYFTQNEWEDNMVKWFGLTAAAKDVAGGLDTGVYVYPFYALAETMAGAGDKRGQMLPTADASQLQFRGTSWGSASSTLEIITNSVIPKSAASLFNLHKN